MCKLYATTMSNETVKNHAFNAGSVIMTLKTGTIIACQDFQKINGKLPVMVYSVASKKWVKSLADGEIAETLCKYHARTMPKKHKNRNAPNYVNMMRHDRKKKKGGCGVRLDKENFLAKQMQTDYECTKEPLHDFRRVYI